MFFSLVWESRGGNLPLKLKVITPLPKGHNTELFVLTVTEPLGKPLHLRHLRPTAISTLQEVTAFFSPPAHSIQFHLIYTAEKEILLRKQEMSQCVTEGKFTFLFI